MWLALHPLAEDCSAGGWRLSDAWSLKTSQLKREKEIVIFFIHTHVKTEIMLYKDFTVSLNLNTISPAIGIGNYFFHSRYSKWLSSDMHTCTYILLRCVKKKVRSVQIKFQNHFKNLFFNLRGMMRKKEKHMVGVWRMALFKFPKNKSAKQMFSVKV